MALIEYRRAKSCKSGLLGLSAMPDFDSTVYICMGSRRAHLVQKSLPLGPCRFVGLAIDQGAKCWVIVHRPKRILLCVVRYPEQECIPMAARPTLPAHFGTQEV